MVITQGIPNLPYVLKDGIKYFNLIAEPVTNPLLSDIYMRGWGYNGTIPGPTIQVYQGDIVNIRVYNKLAEPTSVHWHGLDLPNVMDGVPEVEPSPKIEPNQYFDYRYKIINPPGTHLYHTHYHTAKQEMMGMGGAFIILEPPQKQTHIQRDYFVLLQEFALTGLSKGTLPAGTYNVNPMSHDLNFFTMNGRCFPFTEHLLVERGENIRIRLGNLGMNAHPIHLHGHQFIVTATDGNSFSENNQYVKNNILVAPGETYDIEFYTNNPGIWPFHCHIPHHLTNNFTVNTGGMFSTVSYLNEMK
ncbi:multicopper oxidase family protein [Chengkuizengella axinellae]|uniref:Multicopper oxidase domain-containing protein n=1 Tax=Chengkuizengella axinellae TaxID=3064388 RepID=A0ABT9J1M9_9BACL|nr:multicopper oxidase domain-containing protein [Chengkuizengella sp. 2205SS18-9]MDP5275521.1 multicopper oxidase domain-containing protein [Chengkuizengella sp. 2205SS18-9]